MGNRIVVDQETGKEYQISDLFIYNPIVMKNDDLNERVNEVIYRVIHNDELEEKRLYQKHHGDNFSEILNDIRPQSKYFFETDFVKLSWDKIIEKWPWARWCGINEDGSIKIFSHKPGAGILSWVSSNNKYLHIIKDGCSKWENWRDLLFEYPAEVYAKPLVVKEWPEVDLADIPEWAAGWYWDGEGEFTLRSIKPVTYSDVRAIGGDGALVASLEKYNIHHNVANFKESWHAAHKRVSKAIWQAIELLVGPEYKWLAQDENGSVFVYENEPKIKSSEYWLDSDFLGTQLEALKNFFDSWRESLTKRPW